jgi:translocation and assembly module TamB
VRRRFGVVVAVVALLLVAVLGVLVQRLLYTQGGLEFALRQLNRLQGIRIETTGARGSLAGPLDVERIVVDHEALSLEARDLHVAVQSRPLLAGTVRLHDLSIGRLVVRLKERPERPKTPPRFLPAGVRIEAPSFRIGPTEVTLQGGRKLVVNEATGSLALTRWRLDVDPLDARGPDGGIAGSLALRATEPLGLRTNLRGEWRLPEDAFDYRFRVETRGKLDRLGAELYLDAPAKLSFSGTLLDLTENPRAHGTFRLAEFDGSPWLPPERIPQLTGTIALAAGRKGVGFDGTLTSPALPGQQVRLQGSGRFAERVVEIASFRAWLPRIGLAFTSNGRVELAAPDAPEGTLPRLALSGEWTALRWPLDEREAPVVVSPQGVYTLEGSVPYAFKTRAEVEGGALPRVSFEATGAVDKQSLSLERLDGYALRGRIGARGRLQWTGPQPWAFDVDARSLAIHELRPGVNGTISARGTIAGAGLTATAPWTARLTSLSGTMFGRPLTGRGEIAHRDRVFELRDVRIANGPSFADVRGRVGAEMLDLDWNLDLRSLAIVAPGMSGQLVSRGSARGSPRRPQMTATAQLQRFAYEGLTVNDVAADIDLDSSDRRPSRIAVNASYVATGMVDFDTFRVGLQGLVRDHDLEVAFTSPGNPERRIAEFQGRIAAEGGLDVATRAWSGDLTQAKVEFAEGDEASLIQPASISLGPDLQRSAPLCLRTADDARLCIEGEHRLAPQRSWRVIYSLQDWPLKRLLRTVLGWREFDGRLQASGWAEQEPGKPWVGGSTVLVHEPAFDMRRNKFRTERIQLGSSRVDLYVEPREMRAEMNLEVDETTSLRGEALVDRRENLLESPVRGQVVGRSEVIKVLPLLVPEIDRATGRLNGQVSVGGRLGAPEFTGDFQLRDGRLDLYRTNLTVTALQADGSFAGDALQFKATGQTAKGRLDVDGDFGWPQGQLTGTMRLKGDDLLVADTPDFRVLASPDIELHAGKDGYRVDGQVLIPTARISPRELTSKVDTSPDERVVGVPDIEDAAGRSTAAHFTSSIKVVLGEAVRVEAYGLKARLGGDVTVSTVPDDVARGNGAISVVEGEYKAFGQDVTITKGLLTYRQAPLNEPQLDIVAERKIKDTDITVAVNVRGTLDNPYIAITSTPSMPSNEALSYLLTGRSIDTLQSGEAANVNQAAESLAVSGGGLLLGGLGTKLGLDEFSVERTGEDDTSVVLGKALSPKLFVSYGISIAEAINTIKLRYTLNKRWSVKAESGLEQSADFEYRIER